MNTIRICISILLSVCVISAFDGRLLKPLSEPKPGSIIDILKKPKIPALNIHLSKGGDGFGAGASIGSFGFGFGFGGHYVPPGTDVNLPSEKPQTPNTDSHVPELQPDFPNLKPEVVESYSPVLKPDSVNSKPQDPNPTPYGPEIIKDEVRPNWEEYEDNLKNTDYGKDEVEYDSDTEDKKKNLPSWENIGETIQNDPDSKSENFMNRDLIKEDFIQPRQNMKRNRRFIESHVYHVPLIFRSNAKPFQVKVQSNANSLMK